MGIRHLAGVSTGPGNSLLHFHLREKYFDWIKQPIFHLEQVQLSNAVLMSDEADFVPQFSAMHLNCIVRKQLISWRHLSAMKIVSFFFYESILR